MGTLEASIIFMLLSMIVSAQAGSSGSGKPKATDLMVEACKNASIDYYIATVPQEFCLLTLQSDKRSTNAKDLHDLVFIAIDITKARVIAASGMVKKMLQNAKKGTVTMRVLTLCEVDYEQMASILNICDAMIKDYQGYKGEMRSHELAGCVAEAYSPAAYCQTELNDAPKEVALVKENAELQMLVHMSANFLEPLTLPEEMLF
ncbi:hypothetical protein CFC21_055346 [Triticum aestivum]|uniref:Pectinesterase inhibitor domain-containing protein n=2 Tax=Triticum aestivum TaxID=4565 RepID=A0A3B6I269_WHEAT|nr:hypothetical protein CFC21_055346 [Triticum aestivum]